MEKASFFKTLTQLILLICLAALTACKTAETHQGGEAKSAYLRTGYACCNLHYNNDWISDSNFAQLPFIPAGTPINLKSIGDYRAYIEVDGKTMRLGHDYGRVQETTEQWVNKIVALSDPKLKIAKFSPTVRNAIARGQLVKGMTKEQVIMSVGFPQTDHTPRLDAPIWRYWWSSFGPYYVHWSGNVVSKIDGHPETVGHMTYRGK